MHYPQEVHHYQLILNIKKTLKAIHFQHCPNKGLCRVYPDIALSAGGAARILDLHIDVLDGSQNWVILVEQVHQLHYSRLCCSYKLIIKQDNETFDGVGFINPLLYYLAHSENEIKRRESDFKDVRHGNNCSIFDVSILGKTLSHVDELLCYNSDNPSLFYQAVTVMTW